MNENGNCNICHVKTGDLLSHKGSDLHRFNFLLFEWNCYRKALVKNRDGIKIKQKIVTTEIGEEKCTFNVNKGSYDIKLSSEEHASLSNGISCLFTIENERNNENVHLLKSTLLHPYHAEIVELSDRLDILRTGNNLELKPKEAYEIKAQILLNQTAVGTYEIPVVFCFQVYCKDTVECVTIARQIVVILSDHNEIQEAAGKSPFKNGVWKGIQIVIPAVVEPRVLNAYPIPKQYFKVLMAGLKQSKFLDGDDNRKIDYIRNILCPGFSNTRQFESKFPTPDNYRDFYHFLTWLDEIGQVLMLQRYNMSNVTMKVLNSDILELEVPGLAEKRPSLIGGDIVKIRLHEDHTVYKGVVKTINADTIWINNVHSQMISFIKEDDNVELDVSFELGRLPYERKHKGVDNCVDRGMLPTLFPETFLAHRCLGTNYNINDDKFYNQSILANEEQKTAVLNILNCTSQHAPYIVFGPPGTGKTITIVEAILQIKSKLRSAKILVCAPANAACDMLTSKLMRFCRKEELIRVHAPSRNRSDVPNDVKPYSNFDDGKNKLQGTDLASFRIVVTTLVLIGKFSGKYIPDYVFIDEAAQAMEPEADIAIGLMTHGKQLILAGDPKQLGPSCSSAAAAELKLEVSLLERLMETNDLYKSGNPNFITMLRLNYRSHPTILQIPNELFYGSRLLAINAERMNDPVSKVFIYPRTLVGGKKPTAVGEPIEFCAVFAKEQRQGRSPSFFNEAEIQTTVKCIKAVLSLTQTKVEQSDIGVVTPYIRQVHRLKQRLEQFEFSDVEVGTTEVFQGREKRIMIVTTVRAQHSWLLFDKKYKLGFVSNEKRFNVALTRAMSKLIVIGNPLVLGTDEKWLKYIELCESKMAYFGKPYIRRTVDVRTDIVQRFSNVNMLPKKNVRNGPNKKK